MALSPQDSQDSQEEDVRTQPHTEGRPRGDTGEDGFYTRRRGASGGSNLRHLILDAEPPDRERWKSAVGAAPGHTDLTLAAAAVHAGSELQQGEPASGEKES